MNLMKRWKNLLTLVLVVGIIINQFSILPVEAEKEFNVTDDISTEQVSADFENLESKEFDLADLVEVENEESDSDDLSEKESEESNTEDLNEKESEESNTDDLDEKESEESNTEDPNEEENEESNADTSDEMENEESDSDDPIEMEDEVLVMENSLSRALDRPDSMGSLASSPDAVIIDGSDIKLDSKFSFIPTYFEGLTKVTVNGRTISGNRSTTLEASDLTALKNGEFVCTYENAGFYEGVMVDIIMTANSYGKDIGSNTYKAQVNSGGILGWFGASEPIEVNYKFINHKTKEPIKVSGFFGFDQLQLGVWYAIPKTEMKDVYTVSDTILGYAVNDKDFFVMDTTKLPQNVGGLRQYFMYTYEDVSEINLQFQGIVTSTVRFVSKAAVLIDIPNPVITGDEDNSDLTDDVVEYRVSQMLPHRDSTLGYPEQIVLKATYEEVLEDPSDVKITRSNGTSVTSYFDITVGNGEIIAVLKNTTSSIYGDMLVMSYSSTPKEDADLSSYVVDKGYELRYSFPATATLEDGDYLREGNIAYATTPVSEVPQPSVEMFVNNINGSDIYKVGDRVLYTVALKNLNINPYSSWKNIDLKKVVPSGLRVDTSTLKSVYTKKDGEVIESELNPDNIWDNDANLLNINLGDIYGTEEIIVTFEAVIEVELANSTVTDIVDVTSDGFGTLSDNVIFEVLGILEFISAPASLNFGELEISSKEKVYQLESKEGELIVQDTRGLGNAWSLTAKLASELTSKSGHELLESIYYMSEGQEYALSKDWSVPIYSTTTQSSDSVVISDIWGSSIDKLVGPVLKVRPGQARSESYHGEIQWILQDVPENE